MTGGKLRAGKDFYSITALPAPVVAARPAASGDDATLTDSSGSVLDDGHGIVAGGDRVGANDEIGAGMFSPGRSFIADESRLEKGVLPPPVSCPKLAPVQPARPS